MRQMQQKLVLTKQAVNEKNLDLQEVVSKLEEVEEKASKLELANSEAIAEQGGPRSSQGKV